MNYTCNEHSSIVDSISMATALTASSTIPKSHTARARTFVAKKLQGKKQKEQKGSH
jgi:hypothetical protein